jgi:DNA-binding beta-propeller fold protein YncE
VTTHFDLARAIAALAAGEPARAGYGALLLVDPTEMERAGRVEVCTAPHGVALTGDGSTAVVACYGEDGVAIVDLTGDQPDVVAQVPAGPSPGDVRMPRYGPYAVALSPDESIAYVSGLDGIRVLDMATQAMAEARMVSLTGVAFFGSFDAAGATFWVATQARDGVARIDVATNTIAMERFFTGDECIAPHEATLVPALDRVLVVCEGDHILPGAVLALDPITLETEGRLEVGVYPDALRIVDEVDW